ncbi:MAG: hypothetical protein ACRYHA_34215 [Janthinobacterium lividum]
MILTTGGCATATKTFGADGKPVIALDCSGTKQSWNACLTLAGRECGTAGYTIDEKGGAQDAVANGGYGTYFANTANKRTMVVECNAPTAK